MNKRVKIEGVLLLIGLIIGAAAFLSGKVSRFSIGDSISDQIEGNYSAYSSPQEAEEAFKNSGEKDFVIERQEAAFDNITEVIGKFKFYNVNILPSADSVFHIDYTYPVLKNEEDYNLDIKEEQEKLMIEQIKFKDRFFTKKGRASYLVLNIEVPKDENIEINQDMGIVNIKDGEFNSAVLDTDAGAVNISGSRIKELTNNIGAGQSEIKNSVMDKLNVIVEMGKIDISGSEIKNSDITVKMGEAIISNSNMLGMNNLTVEMGSIRVDLNQRKDEIGIRSETEMGSLILNGEKMELKENQAEFDNFLNALVEMGELDIRTK